MDNNIEGERREGRTRVGGRGGGGVGNTSEGGQQN